MPLSSVGFTGAQPAYGMQQPTGYAQQPSIVVVSSGGGGPQDGLAGTKLAYAARTTIVAAVFAALSTLLAIIALATPWVIVNGASVRAGLATLAFLRDAP